MKYSLSDLEKEKEELCRDLSAFLSAYDIMRNRVLVSAESSPDRQPSLHTWSGTRAVVGSMELAIHAIERAIEGYKELIERVRSGEIENTDKPSRPTLSLVKEI